MAFDAGTVVAQLLLNTRDFTSGISDARRAMGDLGNESTNLSDRISSVGAGSVKAGSTMSKFVTLPILAAGAGMIKMASDFDTAMSQVGAITQASTEDMARLREEALKLGAETAFSSSEAAAGMANLASAGFSVDEVISAMPGMMDMAAASGTDLAASSEIAASTLRGFGLEATEAGRVANVFAKAAADTNADVEGMGEAMKYVAPVARAMGLSLEETAAAVGVLSDAGIKGGQAGTTLRSAMASLAKPSDEAAKAMSAMGFEAFDANGKMLPLKDIIDRLGKTTAGMTDEQKQNTIATIFGTEAMSGMLTLVQAGPDKLGKLTDSLINSDGSAKKMADTMKDNLAGSVDSLMGSVETLGISLGEVLVPMIKAAAESLTGLTNWFNNLGESQKEMIVKVGLILAAVGPMLVIFGKLAGAVSTIMSLMSAVSAAFAGAGVAAGGASAGASGVGAALAAIGGPITLIIAAIAALIGIFVYFYNTNDAFKENVNSTWESIKVSLSAAWTAIKEIATVIFAKLQEFWDKWGSTIIRIFSIIFDQIALVVKTAIDIIAGIIKFVMAIIQGDWAGAWDAIVSILSTVLTFLVTTLSNAFDLLGELFVMLGEMLVALWNDSWARIGSFFAALWEGIKTLAAAAWDGLAAYFAEVWQGICNQASIIWSVIADFFAGIWQSIVSTASAAWNGLMAFFSAFWTGVQAVFSSVINAIGAFMMNYFGSLINGVVGIFQGFMTILGGIWEVIKNVVLGVVLLLIDLVTGNFTAFHDDAISLFNNLAAAFGSIWQGIKDVISSIVTAITSFIVDMWNNLVNGIVILWTGLGNFLTSLWQGIKDTAVNAWTGLCTAVSNIASNTTSWVSDTWNGLLNWFRSLPGVLWQAGANMFNSMRDGISAVIGGIYNAVTSGMSSAIDYLLGLPGEAVTWGSDMIDGIVRGIKNAAGAVGDAVAGVAQDIRSFLHFSVPDEGPLTDYESWMPDFMQGLANGINKNKSLVSNSIKGLAEDMKVGVGIDASLASNSRVSSIPSGKSGSPSSSIGSGLSLVIENFVNNSDKDIEQLAYQLEFYRKQLATGTGGAY